jgi:hypothetical protein
MSFAWFTPAALCVNPASPRALRDPRLVLPTRNLLVEKPKNSITSSSLLVATKK